MFFGNEKKTSSHVKNDENLTAVSTYYCPMGDSIDRTILLTRPVQEMELLPSNPTNTFRLLDELPQSTPEPASCESFTAQNAPDPLNSMFPECLNYMMMSSQKFGEKNLKIILPLIIICFIASTHFLGFLIQNVPIPLEIFKHG